MIWAELGITIVKIALLFFVVLTLVAYLTLAERRVSAFIQDRIGPNRVGPFGLLQPLADGVKFIFKEDIIPKDANKYIYIAAPAVSLVTALIALAVIPIGRGFETTIFGLLQDPIFVKLQIADLNVGVLYILAIGSLSVYGVVLGGWASNSKYSFLGGLRGAAQMVSYELAMGISILGVIAWTGSLRLEDIIEAQSSYWFVFPQILGFIVFLAAVFAETNRLPFDMPEAETEIVAGYHTEYSSMKFAMFFMAEYTHMLVMSCLIVALFFGGWYPLPFGGWFGIDIDTYWYLPPIVFIGKVLAFLFFFIWVRFTLPRFRYDQVMNLGWKVLFPIAILNLVVISIVILVMQHYGYMS
ncbi:MAG: NADH-quinone oxidoreductase subunit NuoH [Candidatus Dadabacteria bacterium]|nr:NADH-quinone oxidoreductase subunit NuoH [Candidatus Dadabacteria bacterium]